MLGARNRVHLRPAVHCSVSVVPEALLGLVDHLLSSRSWEGGAGDFVPPGVSGGWGFGALVGLRLCTDHAEGCSVQGGPQAWAARAHG